VKAGLVLTAMCLAVASGATYYVATTGNDTNPGTFDQPWRNIGKAASTVVAGARGEGQGTRDELLDVSGRKVLDLKPGANDVRALAPGVYFFRQTAGSASPAESSAVSRVVVLGCADD